MKFIELTQGYRAIVDDEDYERASALKWYAQVRPTAIYAKRTTPTPRTSLYLHRFILGTANEVQIDHRDGDGLNCQRRNLRVATQQQNSANRSKTRRNSSGFKGVSKSHRNWPWKAMIKVDGKYIHLGNHANPESAARAYDEAALQHFGVFARLNFPATQPEISQEKSTQ